MKTSIIISLGVAVLAVAFFGRSAFCFTDDLMPARHVENDPSIFSANVEGSEQPSINAASNETTSTRAAAATSAPLGGAAPSLNMGSYQTFSFYSNSAGVAAAIWLQPGAAPTSPWDEFWFDNSGNFNLPGGLITPGPVNIGTMNPMTAVTPQYFDPQCGTGTHDCTAAINSALATGNNLFFPCASGPYYFSAPLGLSHSNQIIDLNGQTLTGTSTTNGSKAGFTNWNNGSPPNLTGVVIKDGTINFTGGPSDCNHYWDNAIYMPGNTSNSRIENMIITNAPSFGIALSGNDGPNADKNIISGNIITSPYNEGILYNGGLSASIENNWISGAGYSGIDINGSNVVIAHNHCYNNGQNTITGANQSDPVSENGINVFIPWTYTGYPKISNASIVIDGNDLRGNGNSTNPGNGIFVGEAINNSQGGAYQSQERHVFITNNYCALNNRGGIWVYGDGQIVIKGNILDRNGQSNLKTAGNSPFDLIGSIAVSPPEQATGLQASSVSCGIISDNIINNAFGCGIILNGSNWMVHHNMLNGSASNVSAPVAADAIYLVQNWNGSSFGAGASWNQITNNQITGTWQYGLYQQGNSGNNRFQDNDITATLTASLYYDLDSNGNYATIISGNHFADALSGIAVLRAGKVTISSTEVRAGDQINVWYISGLALISSTGTLHVPIINNATSFVIESTNGSDNNAVCWRIMH